ncbi:hypothetical protein PNEG_03173 [Pneumocystis murina B123]|uniref:Uncharacterized protein n=1 Tax=Pneumocystis murina (strain B123) TaxID=1069680 RepID=M7NIE2_PNEMU|nr:hypothetical protein PNEG_03173 [Pneumocystis murina B123]EMR08333.1 hypothetical protein PNEG_03173 [Pneumocystis murina B123]
MINLYNFLFLFRICCFIVGFMWIFMLPLNYFNRHVFISENAILPGTVNTYFGDSDSDSDIIEAYREEINFIDQQGEDAKYESLHEIFERLGLRTATQDYKVEFKGKEYSGRNFFAVLDAQRGDGTEALVLSASWKNMDGKLNLGGVSLLLALARYFKRWSLWSKDIIFLIPGEKEVGAQLWVDAYHKMDYDDAILSLTLKSGEIQALVDIDFISDYRNFDSIELLYDGMNGQLSNMDLLVAVNRIIQSKSDVKINMQNVLQQKETYFQKLLTMINGMINQCFGFLSGTQSCFVPYKIDSITFKVKSKGSGIYDDILLGKIIESSFRSLNNLLEHFHQSFFFYFMLSVDRFVSISAYFPSAILIASSFTIDSLSLWISVIANLNKSLSVYEKEKFNNSNDEKKKVFIERDPRLRLRKEIALSIATVIVVYIIAIIFLKIIYNSCYYKESSDYKKFYSIFILFLQILQHIISIFIQRILEKIIKSQNMSLINNYKLIRTFSQIILGIELSTLAIVNFSLSFFVGIITFPLSFVRPARTKTERILFSVLLELSNPLNWIFFLSYYKNKEAIDFIYLFVFGWKIWYLWTPLVLWLLWWPLWIVAKITISTSINDNAGHYFYNTPKSIDPLLKSS